MEEKNDKQSIFYPHQQILWHLKQKKPGQEKFKIKKVYDNGIVDVTTIEYQELGKVNMSKIELYHEPEIAAAYILQALAKHNSEE